MHQTNQSTEKYMLLGMFHRSSQTSDISLLLYGVREWGIWGRWGWGGPEGPRVSSKHICCLDYRKSHYRAGFAGALGGSAAMEEARANLQEAMPLQQPVVQSGLASLVVSSSNISAYFSVRSTATGPRACCDEPL